MRRNSKHHKIDITNHGITLLSSKSDATSSLPHHPNPQKPRLMPPIAQKRHSKSLFITQHDQMEATRVLWRNADKSSSKRSSNSSAAQLIMKESSCIKSWDDLRKIKAKLNLELLKRKSREDIFDQNLSIIDKIENTAPKVDTWSDRRIHNKQKITPHHSVGLLQKNMSRLLERQSIREKIFEQNIKMIQRIEQTPPKVQAWSYKKLKRSSKNLSERKLRQEKLLDENLQLIQKCENMPPKVESWVNLKWLRRKTERKKQLENRFFDAERIKSTLRKAEERLKRLKLQKIHEDQRPQRYKTLPTKIKHGRQLEPNLKNFTAKVQGVKYSSQCWNALETQKDKKYTSPEGRSRIKVEAGKKTKPKFTFK